MFCDASKKYEEEKDCRGMILASVLILMALIVGMVIHSQVVARLALRHARRSVVRAQLRAAAADAVFSALRGLAAEADMFVNHTNETWATPVLESLPNGIETAVVIRDEQSMFDVNNLAAVFANDSARQSSDIVAELLEHCGSPDPRHRAGELTAWFSAGSRPSERMVESPAELGRLLGIDEDPAYSPAALTVLPLMRTRVLPVNVNTALPEVLRAVIGGRDYAAVKAICALRDAHPVVSLTRISDLIGEDRMRACRLYLDVKSSFFSVLALAEKDGVSVEIYALAYRNDRGEIEIMRWVF